MVTEARETGTLIGSDKVEGTAVYGADDTKIGTIERVMIDKTSGRVSYAVLSFGGFLGIGDDHYPLPWQSLKYDTNLGGYRTGITEQQLQGAPKYRNDNSWDWNDAARARYATYVTYSIDGGRGRSTITTVSRSDCTFDPAKSAAFRNMRKLGGAGPPSERKY